VLELKVEARELEKRTAAAAELGVSHQGLGRELFALMRRQVNDSESGATVFFHNAD
jgi:hypothetical protein